jgi:hypothetical protein
VLIFLFHIEQCWCPALSPCLTAKQFAKKFAAARFVQQAFSKKTVDSFLGVAKAASATAKLRSAFGGPWWVRIAAFGGLVVLPSEERCGLQAK